MNGSHVRVFCVVFLCSVSGCNESKEPEMTGSIGQGLCTAHPDDPCCLGSPILLDLDGDGFDLTDLAGGVRFNLNPSGASEYVSWTAPGSDDAWLALDRNGNGVIDDGTELFGNFTPQPSRDVRQGYLALGVFDLNHDNVIDSRDPIYYDLRLWQDRNHDGVSDVSELSTLEAHGIIGLDVRFASHWKTDKYGNLFRYSASVFRAPGSHVGSLSYDVFLITQRLDQEAREQGAFQPNGAVSMAEVDNVICDDGGGGGGGGGGEQVTYKYATIGGAICRAVCWAAGGAICATVGAVCAVGTTVTVGGLVIPCTAAIIAACAASNAGSQVCSEYVCPD
jgi:hypothetical protein